jgi:hypothetical protein
MAKQFPLYKLRKTATIKYICTTCPEFSGVIFLAKQNSAYLADEQFLRQPSGANI